MFKSEITVLIILLLVFFSFSIWSQGSEPLDLSIEKSKIENMLIGSWYAHNFSVPGRMELGWYENILKDAVSISRQGSNIVLSDEGSGMFYEYDGRRFKWEIVAPFNAFSSITMMWKYKLETGEFSDPVYFEILIIDYETLIVSYLMDDGDNPVPMSELWKKRDWNFDMEQ